MGGPTGMGDAGVALERDTVDLRELARLVTDEFARVLDQQDGVIDGLYATGNITATVMGRRYLGAGGSIANTMVFGYVAALHAAGRPVGRKVNRPAVR